MKKDTVILVVEDNELNMELVRDILIASGYTVNEAANAEEFRVALETNQPDLVLMDIQLPIVDGYTLVKELKANASFKHIPVIALTAFAMAGDKEKALDAGCTDVITKPIDTKEFVSKIEMVLEAG